MEKQTYNAIGMMSGTSLDGLDLAYCSFFLINGRWRFELLESKSESYDANWTKRLKESVSFSGNDLAQLHRDYGVWLGQQAFTFIKEVNAQVDLIASHGHTVFHKPEKGLTVQIGSGHELAVATGKPVVCDFRSIDVALGGQGAPLVPIGDRYLFGENDFCLNLGGISNISFEMQGKRIAYDISVANMLLNYLVQKTGKLFDNKGEIARGGTLDAALYEALNSLEYLDLPYPKSTGFEWFEAEVQPIVDRFDSVLADKLHTAVHHIAFQVAKEVKRHAQKNAKLLITGGGAKNTFLIEKLSEYLTEEVQIVIPKEQLVDFKEAIVFAFMGVLRLRNEVNCLASVTGASKDSCGGVMY